MLDFNSRTTFADHLNQRIDAALVGERAAVPARGYLGASRLGVACDRALQFEFTDTPRDPGAGLDGRTLRVFEIGHALEEVAIRWLRASGVDLVTRTRDGGQIGFSVAGGRIRGHVDGVVFGAPDTPTLQVPALWECKTMNAKAWRETVAKGVVLAKPIYAVQIAIYQAYLEPALPGV